MILGGDFYTGSVLASTLTKLVLRFASLSGADQAGLNQLRAEALLIMTSIIRVGQSKFVAVPIDEDSQERIMSCVETLAGLEKSKVLNEVFLEDTKKAYTRMIRTAEVCHGFLVSKRSWREKGKAELWVRGWDRGL